ncbi:MAG: hypothetical protein IJH94_08035 [Clostridia bacterium]|nr:hypothetical protein [Clostridia bacterium]
MIKRIICILSAFAACAALGGCSMTGEPVPTVEPIDKGAMIPDSTLPIYSDSALIDGFFSYDNPDWAFSVQLP